MKNEFDQLIFERAPWLAQSNPGVQLARTVLDWGLNYRNSLELATRYRDMRTSEIMADITGRLVVDVRVKGLSNVPVHGPALIVANHPTGIADGIILDAILKQRRGDAFFYANSDILRVLPQMSDLIVPVEWCKEKRTHSKTRETMTATRRAVADGRIGVIFPSGRLAKRRGLRLYERPWMHTAAMLARKFELPVIPINIRARNSALFYLFDALHPTLRDITLFHETLNKDQQAFRVTVGEPISHSALPKNSSDGIALLRRATLELGAEGAQGLSMVKATHRWRWT